MLGKKIAVGLRRECSKTWELGEVARHTYLAHAEGLAGEVARLPGDHCCCSSAVGVAGFAVVAAVDFAAAAVAVDVGAQAQESASFDFVIGHRQT